jgi:hypothetical protein
MVPQAFWGMDCMNCGDAATIVMSTLMRMAWFIVIHIATVMDAITIIMSMPTTKSLASSRQG